jgi:dihydropteroate synthase
MCTATGSPSISEVSEIYFEHESEAADLMRKIGVDDEGIRIMASKAISRCILVTRLPTPAALILKEQMLSLGGDAAIHRNAINHAVSHTDALLLGSSSQIKKLLPKLPAQPFGLSEVAERMGTLFSDDDEEDGSFILRFEDRTCDLNRRTHIMGILNVTPDSFSDGGRYLDRDSALKRAMEMEEEGADIIDVGGESTRPGSAGISIEEELRRILPVIKSIRKHCTLPVSVDTTKSRVAEAALDEGASMVNDISGLTFDEHMAERIAARRIPLVIMHIRGTPRTMQKNPVYENLMEELISYFHRRIRFALEKGVQREQIIIDPGIGFGKTVEHNYSIIKHLRRFRRVKRPVMVGPSRKSFIGKVLDLPPGDRLEGTSAAVAASILNGAHILRVHDVKEMSRVARICDEFRSAP